jgi:hypothetical protein
MKIPRVLLAGLLAVLGVSLNGCTNVPTLEPSQLTPLQIRAIETRSYEGMESKAMLKTVLNVLQDEGFLVDYGNSDLGLLHASRTIGGNSTEQVFGSAIELFGVRRRFPPTMLTIEATANITEAGNRIKVRLTFQHQDRTVLFTGANANTVSSAVPVTDPRIYQEFFAKLDRGLFIQKQGL